LESSIYEAASEKARADNQGSRRTPADPVGGNSREIAMRLELRRDMLAYLDAAGIKVENKIDRWAARWCGRRSN